MNNQNNKNLSPDDKWIHKHLEGLVDKYAGQYVVVAEGEVFIGHNAKELEKKARAKHPGVIPSGLPIPRPEDFISALFS
jgi:hypothetical protein